MFVSSQNFCSKTEKRQNLPANEYKIEQKINQMEMKSSFQRRVEKMFAANRRLAAITSKLIN